MDKIDDANKLSLMYFCIKISKTHMKRFIDFSSLVILRLFGKKRGDFRSDFALCCCRYAFAQIKHLPLPLRFRADKTFVADLRFRAENIR